MERIDPISLAGKTPEEALPVIEKWINETTKRLNYSMSHVDKTNFVEGQQPMTEEEVQKGFDGLWKQMKALVLKNLGNS